MGIAAGFLSLVIVAALFQEQHFSNAISANRAPNQGPPPPPPYIRGFYNLGHVSHQDLSVAQAPNLSSSSPTQQSFAIQADVLPWPRDRPEVTVLTTTPAWTEEEIRQDKQDGCKKYCGAHGHCNEKYECICDSYWTTNPFVYSTRPYQPNCEWNVIVVIGALIGIAFGLLLLVLLLVSCVRRMCCKRTPKYRKYSMLNGDDMEGFGKGGAGLRMPKNKGKKAQMADSDEESDTMFEARNPRFYGKKAQESQPMLGEASKAQ